MKRLFTAIFYLCLCISACAQNSTPPPVGPVPGYNYDESKVPEYTLPDVLLCSDGTRVTTVREWEKKRRPEVLKLFETEMYGEAPPAPLLRFETLEKRGLAYDGKAIRKQVRIHYAPGEFIDLLLYIPTGAKQPPPVFLGINFAGNHAVNTDPMVMLPDTSRLREDFEVEARGVKAHRWDIEAVLDKGFALATFCCEDVVPDAPIVGGAMEAWPFYSWHCIAAWAWGLSRAMDYLVQEPDVNSKKVVVIGHSRLGKAALWAGATDQRFAMVVSNESGCGGAALSKRRYAETVARINTKFHLWFTDRFKYYNDNEDELPFDQHELLALIAPRPLYVGSAVEDLWSDPRGEFLALAGASPVYKLYGYDGFKESDYPKVEKPIRKGRCGYHLRKGGHAVRPYDWEQYLSFASQVL